MVRPRPLMEHRRPPGAYIFSVGLDSTALLSVSPFATSSNFDSSILHAYQYSLLTMNPNSTTASPSTAGPSSTRPIVVPSATATSSMVAGPIIKRHPQLGNFPGRSRPVGSCPHREPYRTMYEQDFDVLPRALDLDLGDYKAAHAAFDNLPPGSRTVDSMAHVFCAAYTLSPSFTVADRTTLHSAAALFIGQLSPGAVQARTTFFSKVASAVRSAADVGDKVNSLNRTSLDGTITLRVRPDQLDMISEGGMLYTKPSYQFRMVRMRFFWFIDHGHANYFVAFIAHPERTT